MLMEKLRSNYRNKKSLALAMALIVMMSMLTMGAISDKETKKVTLIIRDAFNDIENQREIITRKVTVDEFLQEQGIVIEADDVLNAKPMDKLYRDQVIMVAKSKMVEIHIDGTVRFEKVISKTVGESLEGTELGIIDTDIINPQRDTLVKEHMVITVDRVRITEETAEYDIPYEAIKEYDGNLYVGKTTVKQYGVPGKKREVYRTTTVNGAEASKELVTSEIIKEPINEIVITGTKQNPEVMKKKQGLANSSNSFKGSKDEIVAASKDSGKGFSYSRVLTVTATAYDPSPATNAGYSKTAYGLTPQYGVVAVDPRVIPLGTRLYIESSDGGASWVYGYCIAGDTGGAIKGNKVDLCYNTRAECIQFGRRSATVYVLD